MKKIKNKHKIEFISFITVILFALSGCSEMAPLGNSLRDNALIGKWRSRNDGTVELNADGSGYTSIMNPQKDYLLFESYYATVKNTVGDSTWSSKNGQLTFAVEHTESVDIKLYDGYILLGKGKATRKEGEPNGNDYLGTWCLFDWYNWEITLNEDGTGVLIRPEFTSYGKHYEYIEAHI